MPEKDEEQFWREQVIEAGRSQLETVRKAAASWSALFGAVLGVFGTVAFAGGLTGLDKLGEAYRGPVKILTVAAAFFALAATVLAAKAAGITPRRSNNASWQSQRDTTNSKAEHGLTLLSAAKVCGTLAAVGVFVGSTLVVVVGAPKAAAEPPTVVAIVGGTAVCGPLVKGTGGDLTVAGVVLRGVSQITVVSKCP